MPDGSVVFSNVRVRSVVDRSVGILGLHPVDPDVLLLHKAEQLRLHPPSWMWKKLGGRPSRVTAVSRNASLSVGLLVMSSGLAFTDLIRAAIFSLIAMIATRCVSGIILGLTKFRGPATWSEWDTSDPGAEIPEIPAELFNKARQLAGEIGRGAQIVVGVLTQEDRVLDPYITVDYRRFLEPTERVIIGIWDGDRIIACA